MTQGKEHWQGLLELVRDLATPAEPLPTGKVMTGALPKPIRAVLFDIYGTLLISGTGDVGTAEAVADHEAFQQVMTSLVLPVDEPTAERGMGLFFEAIRNEHELARAAGRAHPEVEVRSIWRTVLQRLYEEQRVGRMPDDAEIEALSVGVECRVNPTWPMPGAPEVLQNIVDAGLRLGIVSNAQFYTPLMIEALLDATVEQLGFEPPLCAWSYQVGEAKPSPALFVEPVRVLGDEGITAGEILYVGNDMLNDIYTASRCGLATCLFAGDKRSLRERADRDEVRGVEPDAVITKLSELEGLLGLG